MKTYGGVDVEIYVDLYIHPLIRLQGIVLNYLSTGTTLPLPQYAVETPCRTVKQATVPFRFLLGKLLSL
jgi:hypothetical protein